MFRRFRDSVAMRRKIEEALYEAVSKEIGAGNIKEGLWTKALSESEGDESKASALYIRLRVQAMKDDIALYESFKRDLEKSVEQSKWDEQEQMAGEQESRTSRKSGKWRCSKCDGPLKINYGSAEILICKQCAERQA